MIKFSFLMNTKGTNVHANTLSGTEKILATFALMELKKPWRGMALSWPVRKRSIAGSDQFIPWQTDPALSNTEILHYSFSGKSKAI